MTLLTIENLKLEIAGIPILTDIDLTVEAGKIVGVIGESGSGKSMTALSVMQLLPGAATVSGSIRLDGNELIGQSERTLNAIRGRDIGMVFQEPMTALNPLMTIGDQVAETLRLRGVSKAEAEARADETLTRVGLPADRFPRGRYPHELSGGQRQRVVIAMAIALKPRLLIADEPTTALDVTTQARIVDLLKRLVSEDGMGMIFITHDLGLVAGLADDIAIMRRGEIVESGETRHVFATLSHPYSRALLAASSHQPVRQPPEPAAGTVLSVQDVVRDYPLARKSLFAPRQAFRAVNGVSLSIARGENVGLVGESGCGKSTLARAILGLEPVQGGAIAIDGSVVDREKGPDFATRRKIQAVFQDPYGSFNPRHRVGRLVSEPFHLLGNAAPHGPERDRRVVKALEEVGLTAEDADKYIHEFSGGQRQRIAIARALIIEPALIVLDEAVSALDVSIRAQILDLFADLNQKLGLAYIFITHDLTVARAITDDVMVMHEGRIVERGRTGDILDHPQSEAAQALVAAAPDLHRAIARRLEMQG